MSKTQLPLGVVSATARMRGTEIIRDRTKYVWGKVPLIAQIGFAVTLAWTVSAVGLDQREPVFAPLIALGAVVAAQTRRLRRTLQLMGGVLLGIAVGEVFIQFAGTGEWQVGVSVVIAVGLATAVKGDTPFIFQAGGTAILLTALPPTSHIGFPRLVNSLIGGVIGLAVAIVFLPFNPVRSIRVAAAPVLAAFTFGLTEAAQALADRDAARAESGLQKLRDVGRQISKLRDAADEARELVVLSPVRRPRRAIVEQHQHTIDHLERAVRNSRPLIRRIVTMINDNEPTPDHLTSSVGNLGEATRLLHEEFNAGRTPQKTQEAALRAVSDAGKAYEEGVAFSGSAVVAQIRTVSTDLLRATGVGEKVAVRMVRRTVGIKTTIGPGPSQE